MQQPFFTICIPTYNRSSSLIHAVNSVLNQNYSNFEILVVDDGSTDDTASRIFELYGKTAETRVQYIYKENGGKYTALNLGITLAKGKFFLILDSDDTLVKDSLATIHGMLCQNPKADGVIGQCRIQGGPILGRTFPKGMEEINYVDFHFGSGFSFYGNRYGDCCDCNRTEALKKLRIPENPDVKFVPESYLFNQLGDSHVLLCSNSVLCEKTYSSDGITMNYGEDFDKKNYLGFLMKYKIDLEVVFKKNHVKVLPRAVTWINYWRYHRFDKDKRFVVSHVSMLGWLVRPISPLAVRLKRLLSRI